MPLILSEFSVNATLLLWSIEEQLADLVAYVSEEDIKLAEEFTNPERRRQFLSWRSALRMELPQASVGYDINGKPALRNMPDKYLSVSHTDNLAAVMLAGKPCGIDIEDAGRSLENVCRRFLSEEERGMTSGDNEKMVVIWTAKEAAFKYYGESGVDFIKDIRITAIDWNSARVCLSFRNHATLQLGFSKFRDHIITRTL